MQTASSRYALSLPTYIIPAVGGGGLTALGLMPGVGLVKNIIDVSLISLGLAIACPMGSSLFLQ